MSGAFTTNPVLLSTLLAGLRAGTTQLPDFQRGWVWDEDRIIGILASVSRAFPIGAVMMLETGGEAKFKARMVQGVSETGASAASQLILDGQQRLTSLFQAISLNDVVKTVNARGQPQQRWFYIDITHALLEPEDREAAFVAMPPSRIRPKAPSRPVLDLSTRDKEFEQLHMPCSALLNPVAWHHAFNKFWGYDPDKMKLFDSFESEIINRFAHYQLPVITLSRQVTKEAVCHVFEKVNTGGMVLTAFELLTASFAVEAFQLRRDWLGPPGTDETGKYLGIRSHLQAHPALQGTEETEYLQAIALMRTFDRQKAALDGGMARDDIPTVSCTRKAVLDLKLVDYLAVREAVLAGFARVSKFLLEQNVFTSRDVPYRTQLVPLAVILSRLGSKWDNHGVKEKLRRWYWCGVLGELYGSAVESRFARDVPEVLGWIAGGDEPSSVRDSSFNPGRLLTLRSRLSAAYKGIYALLMGQTAIEWRTGTPLTIATYVQDSIDIHHIFPKAWCDSHKVDWGRMECIVNKTAISAQTNRSIGGSSPSVYLAKLADGKGPPMPTLDAHLLTHHIDPTTLHDDDFDGFFAARKAALLEVIHRATGKPLLSEVADAEALTEEGHLIDAGANP